jgi:hypothetical protein
MQPPTSGTNPNTTLTKKKPTLKPLSNENILSFSASHLQSDGMHCN